MHVHISEQSLLVKLLVIRALSTPKAFYKLGILPQRSRADSEMYRWRKAVASGDGSGRIFTPQQDG